MEAAVEELELLGLLAARLRRGPRLIRVPCLRGNRLRVRLRRLLLLRLALYRQQRLAGLRRPRRWFRRPTWQNRLLHGAWRTTVRTMLQQDPEMFFKTFRMTPAVFEELLATLAPALRRQRQPVGSLPPGERLALTLYYLATGDYMKKAGEFFTVPPSTVSGVVRETCQAIWDELRVEAFPPLTEERLTVIMDEFWDRWQFPNCIGALDGRHCMVQNFPHGESDWYNYKGSFSMVLMAMCDANYKFTYVDIGGRGRRNDGGLWERCGLRRGMEDGTVPLPPARQLPGGWASTPPVIVADDAFPIGPNLVKPYPGRFLDYPKRVFNYRLSRARRVVENAFGILSARWRVLRRSFISSQRSAKVIIQACVVLHNLLILNQENVPPHQYWYAPPDPARADGYADHQLPRFEVVEEAVNGRQVQDALTDFFVGPGSLDDWQWRHVFEQ